MHVTAETAERPPAEPAPTPPGPPIRPGRYEDLHPAWERIVQELRQLRENGRAVADHA